VSDLARESQGLGQFPALVLVDMIKGFTDPDCALGSDAESVVAANCQLLDVFRSKGFPVFFTTVIYRNDEQAAVFRNRIPALNLLMPDAHWVEVDERLERRPEEPLVEKCWASGFFKTELEQSLRALGVDSLVITGLTTSGCVRATAVDGLQCDFRVVVPAEAVGDRNPDAHASNLFDLNAKYADVLPLAQVLSTLENISPR
jgi:maleamate amidohydrolase